MEYLKRKNGITLISLAVTIIVLLILAGISLNVILDENGILVKASEAEKSSRVAELNELYNLWKSENIIDSYNSDNRLTEFIYELKNNKKITEEEEKELKEKGYIEIGNNVVFFCDGIEDITFTVQSSDDEINFSKTIKEGNIIREKPGYSSYTIEGISKEKEGTYITTGSIEGISGAIEIIGDIQETTFLYTLSDFMHGDEVFYCKVNIDGEEYIQTITVKQGDCITYEEDFVGIGFMASNSNNAVEWTIQENENYSGGKALVAYLDSADQLTSYIQLSFYGRGFNVLTECNENSGILYLLIQNSGNTKLIPAITECENKTSYYGELFDNNEYNNFLDNTVLTNFYCSTGGMSTNKEYVYGVFDAIKIYK